MGNTGSKSNLNLASSGSTLDRDPSRWNTASSNLTAATITSSRTSSTISTFIARFRTALLLKFPPFREHRDRNNAASQRYLCGGLDSETGRIYSRESLHHPGGVATLPPMDQNGPVYGSKQQVSQHRQPQDSNSGTKVYKASTLDRKQPKHMYSTTELRREIDNPAGIAVSPRSTVKTSGNNSSNKPNKVREYFDSRVLEKYDIRALIGKGSFSRVVRAVDRQTKGECAIKMIDARVLASKAMENELAILARISHPFVISLVEIFHSSRRVYLVTELATGGELYDRIIARGAFGEPDAAVCLKMILSGLSYLHGIGITHRDLKPENILFKHQRPDSHILITDFGLAHMRDKPDPYGDLPQPVGLSGIPRLKAPGLRGEFGCCSSTNRTF